MTMTGRIKTIVLMLFAALLLTGCVQCESEQKKAGQKLMEEYFAEEVLTSEYATGVAYCDLNRRYNGGKKR
ncbi:MAG: hypothetical protein K5929_02445 [Lachnospiraceae bacterium]|nr:hypothetical protein [Lachnospiraceae bacterium]